MVLAACITKETITRGLFLQGAPKSCLGASSALIPVFLQQRGDTKHYDLDYALVRFANPQSAGEKLFNLQSEKILAEAPLGGRDQELVEGQMLAREESFTISFASPDLLSVAASFYAFEGGAHGNGGVTNINIDMRGGTEIRTSDVFAGEAIICQQSFPAASKSWRASRKIMAPKNMCLKKMGIIRRVPLPSTSVISGAGQFLPAR